MARLAWASCAVVLALSCGGSDYTPFFGGEGGAGGSAGNASNNSGGQQGSGGSSAGGSSTVGAGGGMSGAGGSTGTAGMTGSGGMMGAGGKGGSGGSSAGGAGSTGMPDSGAAGAGGMAGTPDAGMTGCTSNDTCSDTSYCKKSSCASDVRGTCTPKPKACMDDAEETPVCGCDGVTYFSSCLAEWSGENVALHGICGDGVGLKCTNANPACVNLPNGFCGYLLASAAGCPTGGGLPAVGRCWVLPDNCPTYANRFNTCGSGNVKCGGTCEAVKAERPVFRAPATCN